MNIPRRGILALSTVALLTLSGIQPATAVETKGAEPSTSGTPATGPVTDELTRIIQAAIEDRNATVLASSPAAARLLDTKTTPAFKRSRALEVPELTARKQRFEAFGFSYARASTALTLQSVTVSGAEATASFVEQTELHLTSDKAGPSDVPTIYSVAQSATFKAAPEGWQLNELTPAKGQTGLAMTIVDPGAAPASNGPLTNLPSNRAAPGISGASTTPKVLPTGHEQPAPNLMASYDYNAMINYAYTYWQNYNSNYRTFNDVGGDCTNFVSQAMNAGGWGQIGGWYQDNNAWWYNWLNQSWTWINAQKFANFANSSGRILYLDYLNDMGPADVLQVNWGGAGDVQHTMLVTYYAYTGGYNDIRVTYHTTNTLNRPIWDLYSSYPGAWWYALRT